MRPPATLDFKAYRRLLRAAGPPLMNWFALEDVEEGGIGFAVHAAFLGERLVLVRNRARRCWELPGGRREPGEGILETARRELLEECGAVAVEQRACLGYSVSLGDRLTHGLLCLTKLESLPGPLPGSEIGAAAAVTRLPGPLCYPHIQGRILAELASGGIRVPWPVRLPVLPLDLLSILADSPAPAGRIPLPR